MYPSGIQFEGILIYQILDKSSGIHRTHIRHVALFFFCFFAFLLLMLLENQHVSDQSTAVSIPAISPVGFLGG